MSESVRIHPADQLIHIAGDFQGQTCDIIVNKSAIAKHSGRGIHEPYDMLAYVEVNLPIFIQAAANRIRESGTVPRQLRLNNVDMEGAR